MWIIRDLKTLSPKWDVSIKSFPSECERQRAWSTPNKQGHLNTEGLMHIRTDTETACIGPAWICTRGSPSAQRRSRHMHPSLTQSLAPTDNYLQMKNYFSPYKPLLRPGSMPSTWITQNKPYGIFGDSLSHNDCHGTPLFNFIHPLYISHGFWLFYGIPVGDNTILPTCVCVFYFFFGSFSSVCLFCSILVCFDFIFIFKCLIVF